MADFFLWPLTHSELRMQIRSEWILKTIWSLRQERVFLPLCESDAHKRTLWLPGYWRTWLCACFKLLGESSRKSLLVVSPDAVGESCSFSNLYFVYQSFTHSSFNSSPLISTLQHSFSFFILLPFYWLIQASSKYLLAYQTQRTMTTAACVYWVLGERMQTGYQNSAPASPTVRWL